MLSTRLHQHNNPELLQFEELDLRMRGIRVLNRVPLAFHFVSHLYLDGNHLLSLTGLQQFLNLQVLHFDYNYVSLPQELTKVSNPFFMKELSFIGNPIENNPNLTLQDLQSAGFTRLMRLNPPHSLSVKAYSPALKEVGRDFVANVEETARRRGQYRQEAATTRKSLVGKIYTPKLSLRARPSKSKYRDSRDTSLQQTRDLTDRQHSSPYAIRQSRTQFVSDFQVNPSIEPIPEEERTAGFNSGNVTPPSEPQINFSQQFLMQEKQVLAVQFYTRVLLEKAVKGLQLAKTNQTTSQEGEQLSQYLQTLHLSLIKMKHDYAVKH